MICHSMAIINNIHWILSALPRCKANNPGTSSNTTSVTMSHIQVTHLKVSWNPHSKMGLFDENVPSKRFSISTCSHQVLKGQQEHSPGLPSHHRHHQWLSSCNQVGLSDWARFDEKGTETPNPIFPYRFFFIFLLTPKVLHVRKSV